MGVWWTVLWHHRITAATAFGTARDRRWGPSAARHAARSHSRCCCERPLAHCPCGRVLFVRPSIFVPGIIAFGSLSLNTFAAIPFLNGTVITREQPLFRVKPTHVS